MEVKNFLPTPPADATAPRPRTAPTLALARAGVRAEIAEQELPLLYYINILFRQFPFSLIELQKKVVTVVTNTLSPCFLGT